MALTTKIKSGLAFVAALLAFGFYHASDIERIGIVITAIIILGMSGGIPSGKHEGELDG